MEAAATAAVIADAVLQGSPTDALPLADVESRARAVRPEMAAAGRLIFDLAWGRLVMAEPESPCREQQALDEPVPPVPQAMPE